MQHSSPTALNFEGHIPMSLIVKILIFAGLAAVLLVEHNLALTMIVAVGFALTLAVQERVKGINESVRENTRETVHWIGDGGSFPGHQPRNETSGRSHPHVIDGGSLDRHHAD
ncbi:MAG: hypothetical protein ABW095_12820 [Candidatus Thiodiazotropha sp.]